MLSRRTRTCWAASRASSSAARADSTRSSIDGAVRFALAQQRVELLARDARGVQFRLDLRAQGERVLELLMQRRERRFAVRELALEHRRGAGSDPEAASRRARASCSSEACEERRDSTCSASSRARCCAACAARARRAVLGAQPFALLLELDALRLERGQRVDGRLHAAARRAQIRLGALELGLHVGERGLELAQAPRSIRLARLRGVELRRAGRRARGAAD